MPAIERQRTVDISHHLPGWCFPREVGALWDLLQGSVLHVEVGVFCGKSLLAAACAVQDGGEVVGVEAGFDFGTPTPQWRSDVLAATVAACRAIRPEVRTAVLTAFTPDAAKLFRGRNPTSVYIDAEHTYYAVLEDLEAWHGVLARGGLMVGHDYWAADPGVMSAVEEFFGRRSMEFSAVQSTRLWWHRKP